MSWSSYIDELAAMIEEQDKPALPTSIPQPSDPITNLEDIQRIKDYLLKAPRRFSAIRNYTLFCFGINTEVMCGDIIGLSIDDVTNNDGTIKDKITVRYSATTNCKKDTTFYINKEVQKIIADYITKRNTMKTYKVTGGWDYLFPSNKGYHLDSQSWSNILKTVGKDLNLPYNLGCNSMRKTYMYWQVANHFKEKFQTEQDKKIDKILAAINNGATIVSKEELIELLNE